MTLKCGCVFDGKSFVKHCREHALMVLKKRAKFGDDKFHKILRDTQEGSKRV